MTANNRSFFTDIFIKRPVLAICLNLMLIIFGYLSYKSLNVRQYPKTDLAVVTVKTVYIGANAELVRGYITTPLEKVIASADGIEYLESSSQQGVSTITARLRLNFDVNSALTQVQSKVNEVRNELPPDAESPIITVETSDNRFASMYLSFYSEDLEQNEITDYLIRVVQPQLSSIPGVQKADILGARTFAMRIWLKPEKLSGYGISPSEVQNALLSNNYLSAIGATKGSQISINLTSNTDLKTKKEFEDLVIKKNKDILVKLSDVADIQLGAESYDEDVRFSGQTATFMGIWVLPNANSLDVIKAVRQKIPDIQKRLPAGIKAGIPYDSTAYIKDAISEVIRTLTETIIIVIVVIFLFIGSFKSVLVPVVAIPLSLLGALPVMLLFGFSINLLTLLAIVLAVGLVVDDAIVMLENVERHVSLGKNPLEAAIIGARELFTPIVTMTITLVAVYAPIGIQGGLTGTLFKEFAFTLAGAVFVSGFVAITLSPMMSSRLVKHSTKPSNFKIKVDNFFDRVKSSYAKTLTTTLNARNSVIILAFLIIGLLPIFYKFCQKELAPREDQGVVFGIVQAQPNSTLDQTVKFVEMTQEVFESFPEYSQSFQLIGPNFGFSGMLVKPWSERKRTTQKIEEIMWGAVSKIPGIRMIVTTPPPLPGGSDFPIELVISSTDEPIRIHEYANHLVNTAFSSGKFMFADSDLKYDLPQTEIIFDPQKVSALGLDFRQLGADLSVLLGGNFINRFNSQGRSYKVIPLVKRSLRLHPQQILYYSVSGPNGKLVPLSTFASLKNQTVARSLNRFGQLNSAKIQGATIPGVSIDEGLRVLEEEAKKILPNNYIIDYAGESRQTRKEQNALTGTLLLALILIFLVLASQFESFRDPFIILGGSVPLALTGAILFVFLDFTSLNIYSQVGLVTLVGLVAKNGILIVEFANKLQDEEGFSLHKAVLEASTTRLRPILMTSVATVAGHFPLILASGAGAGARNSIGWVLVTGMIIGTIFTLYIVPCIYTLVARNRSFQEPQNF